jgi:hypothetical protein
MAHRWRNGALQVLERPPNKPASRRAKSVSGRLPLRAARSPGAIVQSERRQRDREGVWRCVWAPIHERVLVAMIERGLSEAESLNPKKVGREAGDLLLQWADRWFDEKNRK